MKPRLTWLLAVFLVVVVGVVAVMSLKKPVEEIQVTVPGIMTQEETVGSISDIEKELSGTTLETESTTDFDADLQSL